MNRGDSSAAAAPDQDLVLRDQNAYHAVRTRLHSSDDWRQLNGSNCLSDYASNEQSLAAGNYSSTSLQRLADRWFEGLAGVWDGDCTASRTLVTVFGMKSCCMPVHVSQARDQQETGLDVKIPL